ncbi:MAG TPA: hypothetical protein VJU14_07250 [Solirubrobacterales bacterium]|nr:hypothetical protein [Solirubrobacterales bacterium]
MPSVKRHSQLGVLVLCGAIGTGGLAGCSTTQEKAAIHQAKSERILEAREKRQEQKKKKQKQNDKQEKGER